MSDEAGAGVETGSGVATGGARARERRGEAETPAPDAGPLVSVIITVSERSDPLDEVYRECSAALRAAGRPFEVVFVTDPWAAPMLEPLRRRAAEGEPIRFLEPGRPLGEAGQLKLGVRACRGSLVLTLPGYHRVEADCLADLVARVEGDVDVAVARRWPRRDSWVNRLQNRVFHALLGLAVRERFHDVACGVRAMKREVLEEVPLYGDFSRFLPLLAAQEGFAVEEVPCPQHPRDRRPRVYAPGVYLRRVIDVIGIFFLLRFTFKPLRFFGLVGSGLALGGAVLLAVVIVERLGGEPAANRPALLLGALLFSLGVQVIALGLVGELIVHLSVPSRLPYRLRERVGSPE